MFHITQLSKWNRDLSQAIGALGSDHFFPSLLNAIRGQVLFDRPCVWLYQRGMAPQSLYHELTGETEDLHIRRYVDSAYLENPFYQASMEQPRSQIYRLSRITHNKLKELNYYRSYYAETQANDEVAYLARLGAGKVINLSLSRIQPHAAFSDDEYELLYLMAEPVAELLSSHARHSEFALSRVVQPGIDHQIELAFKTFGASLLSPREKDVLDLMLHGHSTDATARKLGIAIETVRRHRKAIYRKLDVSSQTDLFSLFINTMSCLAESAGEDPLQIYMSPSAGKSD